MSFQVTLNDIAKEDLVIIEEYLSQFYESTAMKFFESLERQVSLLEDSPFMCPVYEDNPKFRRMIFDNYLLFYSVDESRSLVKIRRIFHQSRDVCQLIEANCED